MGQIWAIENDHGAWIVEVGAAVTFDRLQHDGQVLASGIVDAPIRTNPHGMVTHLKVRGVHGESRSILVPVSTFRSVRARRRVLQSSAALREDWAERKRQLRDM